MDNSDFENITFSLRNENKNKQQAYTYMVYG